MCLYRGIPSFELKKYEILNARGFIRIPSNRYNIVELWLLKIYLRYL